MKEKIYEQPKYLEPVLDRKDHFLMAFLIGIWVAGQIIFWDWWVTPEHVTTLWRMILNTVLLAWTFAMPAYFFFFVLRMRKPVKVELHDLLMKKWRVAMVTTKVPSEPFEVIKKTLEAMLDQKYPHDVWLGDEDPQEETLAWCKAHGVKVYTRKGLPEYNRDEWPRRKKCKEGNLAYFYDHFGYDDYDLVVQLDADHVPQEGYLEAILTPFRDNEVGYVSAPSICGANGDTSWSARGRLYAEATLHGPLQAGYTNGFAPLCIGSHYAVRTKALKEIGGIGPELAEDHSTSLIMQAGGWKGVHALDAIAFGDGPVTFADCMKQEFQWSRSLAVLLLTELPKRWRNLSLRLKFQFLFAELWYPIFALTMFAGSLLAIVALLTKTPWVNVSYVFFLLFSLLFTLIAIVFVMIVKDKKLLRPVEAPVISWEMLVYQLVRWPWEMIGVIAGFVDVLLKKNFSIKVTPKGEREFEPLPLTVLSPYIIAVLLYLGTAFFVGNPGDAQGYFYFVILGIVSYVGALAVIVLKHKSEAEARTAKARIKNNYENS